MEGEKFIYKNNVYVKHAFIKGMTECGTNYQCNFCDLYVGNKKLCLDNSCPCGECGFLGTRCYVFKKINVKAEDMANLTIELLKNRIDELEVELREERRTKIKLIKEKNELYDKFNKLQTQMQNIYANINTAIKKEIYKNLK